MIYEVEGLIPQIGAGCFVAPSADIIGDVVIGDDCSIWFGVLIRGDVDFIRIGHQTNIQDLSCLHVTRKKHPLRIGAGVTIAHHVMLHGCEIGDLCMVGMSSTIMDGAVIGGESLVGAGALVLKNTMIPSRSLVLGNPAKVIRPLTEAEVASLHQSRDNYLEYKEFYRRSFRPCRPVSPEKQ